MARGLRLRGQENENLEGEQDEKKKKSAAEPLTSEDVTNRKIKAVKSRFVRLALAGFVLMLLWVSANALIKFYSRTPRAAVEVKPAISLGGDAGSEWRRKTEVAIQDTHGRIGAVEANISKQIEASNEKTAAQLKELNRELNETIGALAGAIKSIDDKVEKEIGDRKKSAETIEARLGTTEANLTEKLRIAAETPRGGGGSDGNRSSSVLPFPPPSRVTSEGNASSATGEEQKKRNPYASVTISNVAATSGAFETNSYKNVGSGGSRGVGGGSGGSGFRVRTGLALATILSAAEAPVFNFNNNHANDYPVLLSVDTDMFIPNDETIDLNQCWLLASAAGNMNTHRLEVKLSTVSCSMSDAFEKTWMHEEAIDGWVIGEEGVFGIKGRLVTRNDDVIALSALLGALQGIADSQTESTTTLVPGVGSQTTFDSEAMRQNALSGALSGGLDPIIDFYSKILDAMSPTISVMPGRQVTVLFKGQNDIGLNEYRKPSITDVNTIGGDAFISRRVITTPADGNRQQNR
jgi:hypothetical protein